MKYRTLLFTCCLILIASCEKESALDKYYNQKGNFSGSIYDALDTIGLYKDFIYGIDSSDLANQLKNTLVTVIAPSDKAFMEYLEKHGYDSISSIPKATLQDLIGHHVITWPHSPTSFVIDPFYFKRQTHMAQRTVIKYDPISQTDKEIVSEAKYMQFYFPEMIEHYGGTLDDYTFLTGKELSPTTNFNIYNIPVDSIVPFGNGWVYYVDEVVEPVQNLDDWLLNATDYSMFSNLFNRYNVYYRDNVVNRSTDVKRSNAFQNERYYRIDMELCFETVGYIKKGNSLISLKASSGYTVVAPKNNVLEEFIDTYFKDYPGFKESLFTVNKNSIDQLHIHKLIRSIILPYLFIDRPLFPSHFSSDEGIGTFDGTILKLNEQDFSEYNLCSNGFGYGINTYIVPRTFKSILKPIFTSPDYKYFTAAVLETEISGYLNDKDASYTLMLPTDSAFIKNNILLVDAGTFNSEYGGDINLDNGETETVFIDITQTEPSDMVLEDQDLFDLVFNHLFTESITPTDEAQYALSAIGSYVGITQDIVWSGGNMVGGKIPEIIQSLTGGDNGQVYVVNDLIKSPTFSLWSMIKSNSAFSRFQELCENAELVSGNRLNVYGNYPTVFIPTNDAIDQFITEGNLPSDEEELQDFVKYFFVDQVVFTSQNINETTATLCKDDSLSTEFINVYKTVELSGSPGDLKIKGDNNDSTLNVISPSNIICNDGIIHQIDGVLN